MNLAPFSEAKERIMGHRKGGRIAEAIRQKALSYPETNEDHPWGESAFKVKGKTFVFMGEGEAGMSFSIKLGDSRDLAMALPGSQPTHYGLGKKGWVTIRPTPKTSLDVLYFLIDESYRTIAPKRMVAQLGEPPRLP
jgi:predicted DNA-binding protein (MmcQ/YjbR family)